MSAITFKYRHQIDTDRWDEAVIQSSMPLIYGLSTFYDHLCAHWGALVLGDYEAVMPIPYQFKWGVMPYIYQPAFIQQSGIFSKHPPDSDLVKAFIKAIPLFFVRTHFHLNYNQLPPLHLASYMTKRVSYEIDLNRPYNLIKQDFNKDAIKNLRKFKEIGLQDLEIRCHEQVSTQEVLALFRSVYGKLNPEIQEQHYSRLTLLVQDLERRGLVQKIGIFHNQKPWALGLFWNAMGRIHYAMGAPTEEGRKHAATHFLIAEALRVNANTPCFFDFEGSSLPNVAQFYKKFGSEPRYFYTWSSRIPASWTRWF